jgi:hypothetical protein
LLEDLVVAPDSSGERFDALLSVEGGFLTEGAGVVESGRTDLQVEFSLQDQKQLLRASPVKLKRLALLWPGLTIRRASRVELQQWTFRPVDE